MPVTTQHLLTPAERTAELLAQERAVRRELRRVYARAVVLCLLSLLAGLACIAWALHTSDRESALLAFWIGLLIGNGGMLVTLMVSYHRAMDEGWL